MKKFKHLLLFTLMFFLSYTISLAKEIPDHDSNYYIDELNVLSEDTKQLINEQSFEGGEQIFVLTVDNMDEDLQDYAVRAFEKYKLGAKGKDNGLLMLLARTSQGKHHVWVTTGYGLEDILPDGKVGRIIDDYMMDYFRNGDLDGGIKSGFKRFEYIIKNSHQILSNTNANSERNVSHQKKINEPLSESEVLTEVFKTLLCLSFIPMSLLIIRLSKRGTGSSSGRRNGGGYYRPYFHDDDDDWPFGGSGWSSFGGSSSFGGGSTGGGGAGRSF